MTWKKGVLNVLPELLLKIHQCWEVFVALKHLVFSTDGEGSEKKEGGAKQRAFRKAKKGGKSLVLT